MTSLTIPAIVFIIAGLVVGSAEAQTYTDIHLAVNGAEQVVGTANPELSNIPSGQVYSTIHLGSEPEKISCSLENCVSEVVSDQVYGGWLARVSGNMGNTTSQIQLVNSQGEITYTMVLMPEPEKQVVVSPKDPSPLGVSMPKISNEVLGIGIGAVAVIGLVVWRSRNVGKIRRI